MDVLRLQSVAFDILKPQSEVNDLNWILKLVATCITLKGTDDGKTRLVEVTQDQEGRVTPTPKRKRTYPLPLRVSFSSGFPIASAPVQGTTPCNMRSISDP